MEIKGYGQWHSLPSEYWSECCNKNDSYNRLADTAFLIGYRYSVIYSSIFIDIMISVNDLQDKPEGLDVSVLSTDSVSGLPVAPHPYG